MRTRGDTLLRLSGLILGLAAAASLVAGSRIPPGTGVLGADVIMASGPTGELAVSPTGPFLAATNLSPGAAAAAPDGTLDLTNQTGATLDVQLRGTPSTDDMDDLLHVRVTAAGRTIFDGTLGGFRGWTSSLLTLAPGQQQRVTVATWLDPQDGAQWSGRVANVFVEFRSTAREVP
jgi:hypothetical protein